VRSRSGFDTAGARGRSRWLEHECPKAERVSLKTLYHYLEDKPEGWFVSELVVAGASKKYQGRVSRLMVLEEHAEAIDLQKMRIREMRGFEQKMEGMPVSEVRANLASAPGGRGTSLERTSP
jgi:hypothetical protein